jgi:dTDP-4-dehydrorhamnose 3,5-epimerase
MGVICSRCCVSKYFSDYRVSNIVQVIKTDIPDIILFEPRVFGDARGFFFESYNKRAMAELGIRGQFVQDNHSRSTRGVLRGLHYQVQQSQGKLVRVIFGEVYDVAVDMRRRSPTFGKWVGFLLSEQNKRVAWVPPGFAHGFLTLSDSADFFYKTTDYYAPDYERCIVWDDPDLAIDWPLEHRPVLSAKDQAGRRFKDAELFP